MNIFEVCFGLDHPYFLQTLALWTYLDTKAEKTDAELIALTNFSDNRPVDIVKLLENALCFGLDHPYFLQTLALWTYLDTKADKTDAELIALTNFSDNRPVDIVKLLENARMLPSEEELEQKKKELKS
ncbi:unnamed protein product [Strongylus vulgaris]|uniref:Uncharacterized protein n=1 Tax=Strongylus vulgaris TaxID=40348 RepID=A0A3P7LLL2_STRVU|nr:unnamed protein product [Strongylus vulgaris]